MVQLGLIGKKLGHSFSPDYFEKKLKALGLFNDISYQALEFSEWDEAYDFIKNSAYMGYNVTIPFKKDAAKTCDYLDPWALKIKAVNTLVIGKKSKIFGYNTDAPGFLQTLKEHQIKVKKALILGSGGAASAVGSAIEFQGGKVLKISRSKERGDFLYRDLREDLSIVKSADIIINCTPLGTFPEIHESPPLPYHQLNSNQILYDLVYNPAETLFLRRGKEAGCKTINGYTMLCNQAELSWEIWKSFMKENT